MNKWPFLRQGHPVHSFSARLPPPGGHQPVVLASGLNPAGAPMQMSSAFPQRRRSITAYNVTTVKHKIPAKFEMGT